MRCQRRGKRRGEPSVDVKGIRQQGGAQEGTHDFNPRITNLPFQPEQDSTTQKLESYEI
jgi:hypothetical protein